MTWMIYGAYGYTGRLVAALAAERGELPVLAGRDERRLRELGELFELEHRAFDLAKGPALAVAAVLAVGALVFWRVRRRDRVPAAWTEAACPACLGLRALAERVPALAGRVPGLAEVAAADPVGSGPGDQPTALVS